MTNSGVARKKACPQSIFSTLFARDAASGYQYCSNLFKLVSQPTSCLFHSLLPAKDRATDTPIRATPKRPQIPTCTKITCCSTDSYRPHRCCHLQLYACIYVRIYLCTSCGCTVMIWANVFIKMQWHFWTIYGVPVTTFGLCNNIQSSYVSADEASVGYYAVCGHTPQCWPICQQSYSRSAGAKYVSAAHSTMTSFLKLFHW